MPVLTADQLRSIARRMVAALGAPPDEALLIADSLVDSNLAGHDSHGVLRLEQYARMVRDGHIVPGAPTEVVHETAATALIDGIESATISQLAAEFFAPARQSVVSLGPAQRAGRQAPAARVKRSS